MIETVEQYLETLNPEGKAWVGEFIDYVLGKYPERKITMFRQRPMFKKKDSYLEGYVMFTAAKTHFSFHTLNFDIITKAKSLLPNAGFGKGVLKVKYKDIEAKSIIKKLCNDELSSWWIENGIFYYLTSYNFCRKKSIAVTIGFFVFIW